MASPDSLDLRLTRQLPGPCDAVGLPIGAESRALGTAKQPAPAFDESSNSAEQILVS